MPRPMKDGLDYWARDVEMTRDPKLRKPKQKYGYIAVGVYESLLDIIYGDKGYYVDYSDPEDLAYLVRERLDGKHQPSADLVKVITQSLIENGLFDQLLCQGEAVLTSRRIQEQYYRATVDRIRPNIQIKYWLLSIEEMGSISTRHFLYKNLVNRPKNEVNRPKNYIKQSKEYKEDEEDTYSVCDTSDMDIYEFYEYIFSTQLNNGQIFELKRLVNIYGEDEIYELIEEMKAKHIKYPLRYMQKVLGKRALYGN